MALVLKNPPASSGEIRDVGLIPGLGRYPGGGHGNPLQCSCLEKSHGQRNLVGYSPLGCKESDMTEVTQHTHTHNAFIILFYTGYFLSVRGNKVIE